MTIVFETERLLFRLFTAGDAELVYQLNRDPSVTEFTGDPIHSTEHAKEVLETRILPQYALYNHGRWATHLRYNMQFIGWCGLKYRPELDEVDLGYRFMPAFWGKGYATEAAWGTLQYGFQKLGLQRIVGRAMPENIGSVKVLEKCGMHYIGDQLADGHMARTYELSASDFNRQYAIGNMQSRCLLLIAGRQPYPPFTNRSPFNISETFRILKNTFIFGLRSLT